MIKSIKLRNLLSFGDPGLDLELKPLNVLIGPNGSGKSNLIDAISLLQAAPRDIAEPIRKGGGIGEWANKPGNGIIGVEVIVETFDYIEQKVSTIAHLFDLLPVLRPTLLHELIGFHEAGDRKWVFVAEVDQVARVRNLQSDSARELKRYDHENSALSQLRGSEARQIELLADEYESVRIYRDWVFGRHAFARQPQRADERNDFLAEDASNLGLVLNRFRASSVTKKKLLSELRNLLDGATDFDVLVQGGTVQLFLEEYGRTIPSTRLSDGTLRYLALLAILCDPKPPRIICVEEPELGLHPDLLPHVARLMIEASERCQIIATTHSDVIVDALTEHADSVIVCERGESGSTMRRLDAEKLKPWLEDYRLGQLWSKGELGGNRW
jgi:predicted ATPase